MAPTRALLFACTGTPTTALIDDESAPTGTAIAGKSTLSPVGCGNTGTWFDYSATITAPNPTANTPFVFSSQPAGLPADAGIPATSDAGVAEGGIVGPRAACIAGSTSTSQYNTSGVGLNFATLPPPDAGVNALQVPINASSYTGVQFWIWGGGDAGSQSIIVALSDQNETPGLGPAGTVTPTGQFCDSSPTAPSATACGQTTHPITVAAGWQFVQIPYTLFANNPGYGNLNETMLDPTTLTQLQWQIQQPAADAAAGVSFDFCLYGVSFYH